MFSVCYKFCNVVFSFLSMYLKISLWFFSWTHLCCKSELFNVHIWGIFFFFLFILLLLGKILLWYQSLKMVNFGLTWFLIENVFCVLEIHVFSAFLGLCDLYMPVQYLLHFSEISYVRCIYIFTCYSVLVNWPFYRYTIFISLHFRFSSVCFVWYSSLPCSL